MTNTPTTKKVTQSDLSIESKAFWKTVSELSTKGRFVQFVDGEPQVVSISNWNTQLVDSKYGKKPVLTCDDGRFLKVESKRLQMELSEYVGKSVKLSIVRYDSKPVSSNTWYTVSKV